MSGEGCSSTAPYPILHLKCRPGRLYTDISAAVPRTGGFNHLHASLKISLHLLLFLVGTEKIEISPASLKLLLGFRARVG